MQTVHEQHFQLYTDLWKVKKSKFSNTAEARAMGPKWWLPLPEVTLLFEKNNTLVGGKIQRQEHS